MEFVPQYLSLSNNEKIAIYEKGQEKHLPTLFFVHGNLSSARNWYSTFQHLSDYFHLVAIDLRGFGMSSYRNKIKSLADFGQDLAEIISIKNFDQVTLLGWSMGGGICLEVAHLLPHRIKQIILLSSVGVKGYRELDFINPFAPSNQWVQQIPSFNPVLQSMERSFLFRNRITIQRLLRTTLFTRQVPDVKEEAIIIEQVMRQVNLKDVYKALIAFNFTNQANGYEAANDKAANLTVPIHIWHGLHDQIVPIKEARTTAQLLKTTATLKIFSESGHAIMVDEPQRFYQSLIQLNK